MSLLHVNHMWNDMSAAVKDGSQISSDYIIPVISLTDD